MKTLMSLLSNRPLWTGKLFLLAFLLAVPTARAGLTVNLLMYHTVAGISSAQGYAISAYLSTNSTPPDAPLGHYTVASPGNAFSVEYQSTSSNFTQIPPSYRNYYSDFDSFMQQVTNGDWTITVTNDTATNVYHFAVTATGFTSNIFGAAVVVTYPTNGEANIPSQPTYTWQGPSAWSGSLYVQEADIPGYNSFQSANLSPSETNWTSPTYLSAGTNDFFVDYTSNASPFIVASTPVDNLSQPISGWTSTATLETYQFVNFSVGTQAETNLVTNGGFETGDFTDWSAGSGSVTTDPIAVHSGTYGAEFGPVGSLGYLSQTLSTTPGTKYLLSFWLDSPDGETPNEFQVSWNGTTLLDETNLPAIGWTNMQFLVTASGPSSPLQFGFRDDPTYLGLDDVSVVPAGTVSNTPVSVGFNLLIERENDLADGLIVYLADPQIVSVNPAPITTDSVVSADTFMQGEAFPGNAYSSYQENFNSLDQLIYACTNGQWTLYINKGDPSEHVFHFNVSISGLGTNLLADVNVLVPTNTAVNVATNSQFQWSGLTNFSSVYVYAEQSYPSYTFDGSASLPGDSTNWPSPPALGYGTNIFNVSYTSFNFPGVSFSTPVDSNMNPVGSWGAEATLTSLAQISFVVGAPAPLPVLLSSSPPQANGGNFQLSFQTLAGRPETIQMRTNLTSGIWMDVTNFIGDGSTYQFIIPTTNAPGVYFRVETQ